MALPKSLQRDVGSRTPFAAWRAAKLTTYTAVKLLLHPSWTADFLLLVRLLNFLLALNALMERLFSKEFLSVIKNVVFNWIYHPILMINWKFC